MTEFLLFEFLEVSWRDLIDIGLSVIFFYTIFQLFKGSRTVQMVLGFIFILVLYGIAEWLDLRSMRWIFSKLSTVGIVAIVIVFQPELRAALLRLGQNTQFNFLKKILSPSETRANCQIIIQSLKKLQKHQFGALIVFQANVGLRSAIESGITLNADLSEHLLTQIFYPNTPLHDGAVVISQNKIIAAACTLPVSAPNTQNGSKMGLRHRAAIGLSQESDAFIIVLSEETGLVSIVLPSKNIRTVDWDTLNIHLQNHFTLKN